MLISCFRSTTSIVEWAQCSDSKWQSSFSAYGHLHRPPALIFLMDFGGHIGPQNISVASEPPDLEDMTCRGYSGECDEEGFSLRVLDVG